MPASPTVVALGGNAITRSNERGDILTQFRRAAETARILVDAIAAGHQLIVTHGNGPQVGAAMRRVELAKSEIYPIPLDICGADTQGGMGYMIALSLNNELQSRGRHERFVPIVTTVAVAADDPAFHHPTKPIGSLLTEAEARSREAGGWRLIEVDGGWRRVVPSPVPVDIIHAGFFRDLAVAGHMYIAAGGGGVPVLRDEDGNCYGVEAVIDKDLTSALLASLIHAGRLVIATSVERVVLNYHTPNEQPLAHLTASEARTHLQAGQFPEGSMGPKIQAAIDFLERSEHDDAEVVICDMFRLRAALAGDSGTRIVRG